MKYLILTPLAPLGYTLVNAALQSNDTSITIYCSMFFLGISAFLIMISMSEA